MFPIYIPTAGRTFGQVTLDQFPDELVRQTTVVLPEQEVKPMREYRKGNRLSVPKFLPHGKELRGIYAKMDLILETALKRRQRYIVIVDDDFTFARRIPGTVKLLPCEPGNVLDMFTTIRHALFHEAQFGSITPRGGNNRFPINGWVKQIGRMCGLHAWDMELVKKTGVRYTDHEHPAVEQGSPEYQLMGDFDMVLKLLRMGHPNFLIYSYTYDQVSNAPGGCSVYRTPASMEMNAKYLEEKHAPFVKAVVKKPKVGWEGMRERWDVRVQWKKAYESSL